MTRPFPKPACATCGARAKCEQRGESEPDYPRCHTPLRDIDGQRLRRLLAECATHDGAHDPLVQRIESALLSRHEADTGRYSELLEHSVSIRGASVRLYRFSYGIPWLAQDPRGAWTALFGLVDPIGTAAAQVARRVAAAASKARCVAQPIFGLAHDGPAGLRWKLYLQFRDDAGAAALELAERLLQRPELSRRLGAASHAPLAPLHLLGLDFDVDGRLRQAKLYFRHGTLSTDGLGIPPSEALDALGAAGVSQLHDVLFIHSITGPDDIEEHVPREIDFGLAASGLVWDDVRMLEPFARTLEAAPALAELERSFRLGFRRVSVSVGALTKLNAYYVLAEPLGRTASG